MSINQQNLHSFSFSQLQRSDPGLSFHLRRSLDMERLRASVGDHERTRIHGVYQRPVKGDAAPASVRHLGLVPATQTVRD